MTVHFLSHNMTKYQVQLLVQTSVFHLHLFTQAPFDFELSFNICQIQQAAILNIFQFKNLNEFCWVNIYFVFIHCKIRQRSEVT